MTETEKALGFIEPAALDYSEWLSVGLALKRAGLSCSVWDEWSRRDPERYHDGECYRKWDTFNDISNPITEATLFKMAKERGYKYEGQSISWDGELSYEGALPAARSTVGPPADWQPHKELIRCLKVLFEPSDIVGYVTKSYEKDGKYLPASKGCYDRNAGTLIENLEKCNGDIGAVLGDYNVNAGAWLRFNPLDGKGVSNNNVTRFRYALVESDNVPIDRQYAIIKELELPAAALIFSGGKSLHAIIRVEAADYKEYRDRVSFLYEICRKKGLSPDEQCRNPARLCRMPGVIRGDKKQFIVDTNIGKASWNEWREWISGENDELPEVQPLSKYWNSLPPLSPPLIEGVLRQGHKMLLAGPSKAGKSFALIELCAAIAEGRKWLDFQCAKGRVMYVNLELDEASCLHRFHDVYDTLGYNADNIGNIDVWNLRGKSVPMDDLAPMLIRRAAKKNYIAVVIDPIYKVITGDENSANEMARFCNNFDKVCTELGCAVIYCHHHSKGTQGSKRSMDRASGSGVFARDPDALLDLIELELTENIIKEEKNKAVCGLCEDILQKVHYDDYSQDDAVTASEMLKHAQKALSAADHAAFLEQVRYVEKRCEERSAWRIEGTLREFPKFPPIDVWFDFPVHRSDNSGVLHDLAVAGDLLPYQVMNEKRKKQAKQQSDENKDRFESAVKNAACGEPPTVEELVDYLGSSDRTVRRYILKFGYQIDKRTKLVTKNDKDMT